AAFKRLSRLENIIPALETYHALAYLGKLCPTLPNGTKAVLNCSGRGDKDVHTVSAETKGFFDYNDNYTTASVGEVVGSVGEVVVMDQAIVPVRCLVWFLDQIHYLTAMPW
ncbi:tryptophan synthase beta chain 1, partial [Tanacetum coccineum]